jgi:hypothetical protein
MNRVEEGYFLLVVVSGYLRKNTEWKHTNFSRLHFEISSTPEQVKETKCVCEPRFQRVGGGVGRGRRRRS